MVQLETINLNSKNNRQNMEPINRFNIRINNQNSGVFSIPLDGSLSERSQNHLNYRPKNSKSKVHLFHKRNNTAITDMTEIAKHYQPLSSAELREQLQKKEKYLQSLIEQIVESEEAHKLEMNSIDQKYEAQIEKMHQELQSLVQKNRMLRSHIGQKQQKAEFRKNRSPRISNETLLLDSQQIISFDFE